MGENISILNKRNEFLHSADFKLFSQWNATKWLQFS
jgi:hypothetical protein